jgi:hypothetical protein
MMPMLIAAVVFAVLVAIVGSLMAARHARLLAPPGADLRWAGRARDARGRIVKLIDPMPLFILKRHDVIDASALERIAEDLEPGARSRRLMTPVAVAICVLAIVVVAVDLVIEGAPARKDLLSILTSPVIIIVVVAAWIIPWATKRTQRMRRVRAVMLRHRRCPHCGYGLDGVPASPDDGATVCPECACAWRVSQRDPATGTRGLPAIRASAASSWRWLTVLVTITLLFAAGVAVAFLIS